MWETAQIAQIDADYDGPDDDVAVFRAKLIRLARDKRACSLH
jgi:hypothetical protein